MSITLNKLPNVKATDYDSARYFIRSGDILLCSGKMLFSKLIKKATDSIWSHVGFILRLPNIDRLMVLESVESIGVRAVTLRSYAENYNGSGQKYPGDILIARHADFVNKDVHHLSKYAIDLLGHQYNTRSIAKIAGRIGLSTLGLKSPRDEIKDKSTFICSEYAHDCYQSVGIDIPYDPRGFITPADFAKDPKIEPRILIQ